MDKIQNIVKGVCLTISATMLVFATSAVADQINLSANEGISVNGTWNQNSQNATIFPSGGSNTVNSNVNYQGASISSMASGAFTGAYSGSLEFSSTYNIPNSNAMFFGPGADYAITLPSPATITFNWTDTFSATAGYPNPGQLLGGVQINADGTIVKDFDNPVGDSGSFSGQASYQLSSGFNLIALDEYSDFFSDTATGTQTENITFTVTGVVPTAVPTPGTFVLLCTGLSLSAILRVRRRQTEKHTFSACTVDSRSGVYSGRI